MDINFDCIKSLIESKVNSFIEIKGFTYKNKRFFIKDFNCGSYNSFYKSNHYFNSFNCMDVKKWIMK
ncbi:hypothetical protein [uncultured Brachyspira sp.]|uniref:hypothetical protein n=1 Tax=uncultured Brachyspira sp. TaxID=221953 RepID=UPI0026044E9D|nr:hypothetical protein [uncultured Brachyspira sp.]